MLFKKNKNRGKQEGYVIKTPFHFWGLFTYAVEIEILRASLVFR
jgi:hypothetical protein